MEQVLVDNTASIMPTDTYSREYKVSPHDKIILNITTLTNIVDLQPIALNLKGKKLKLYMKVNSKQISPTHLPIKFHLR